MGLIETEGLILKSYSLAEADKIIVLLTQNEGLIRGVAKGAKRLKSRFGGSLEPFTIVQSTYFQKEERELVSISQMELVKSYFESASDPEFLQKFSYLADLLMEFAPPHDPNEKLYRMVKACLEAASMNLQNLGSIALYFELWILRLGGYLPDWNVCQDCKRELPVKETAGLQLTFHLLCNSCKGSQNKFPVTAAHRFIFNAAQKLTPLKFIETATAYPVEVKDVSAVLKKIISSVLGREIVGEKTLMAGL